MLGMSFGAAAAEQLLLALTEYEGSGVARDIVTGQNLAGGALVWLTAINAADQRLSFDTERGVNKWLYLNSANAELTHPPSSVSPTLTAFNPNGYSLGADASVNTLAREYLAFSWLIEAGYVDVVDYIGDGTTPRNIPHGLAADVELNIIKQLDDSGSWVVGHEGATWTKWCQLQSASAFGAATSEWNNTAPTSSVFTVGNSSDVNANGKHYQAILFAERAGKSKFGIFKPSNAIPVDIICNFKPKLFLSKNINASYGNPELTSAWYLTYERDGSIRWLRLNTPTAEKSGGGSGMNEVEFLEDRVRLPAPPRGDGYTDVTSDHIYGIWG